MRRIDKVQLFWVGYCLVSDQLEVGTSSGMGEVDCALTGGGACG